MPALAAVKGYEKGRWQIARPPPAENYGGKGEKAQPSPSRKNTAETSVLRIQSAIFLEETNK